MHHAQDSTEHAAVSRLFDLAKVGEIDNVEFVQLDSLVYQRLAQAYDACLDPETDESIS